MKKDFKKYFFIVSSLFFVLINELTLKNYAFEINNKNQVQTIITEESDRDYLPEYILGPGDGLKFDLLGIPEFSGEIFIGPDGMIYLSEVGAIYAEGHTLNELEHKINKSYEEYMFNPEVSLRISAYRPIRVFITGEVVKPGVYTIGGGTEVSPSQINFEGLANYEFDIRRLNPTSNQTLIFPSLFDAIKAAKGITPYSNISQISVIRKNTLSNGGGKIKADINFLAFFTDSDESQNIRLYDGDIVRISKSDKSISNQLAEVRNSNLNPDFLNVYVSGNVPNPGLIKVPRGSGIVQAISLAGGPKLFSGKVNFLRFKDDGNLERRSIRFNPKTKINTYKNPLLLNSDVIHINKSILGRTTSLLNEVAAPVVTSYSLYTLFD